MVVSDVLPMVPEEQPDPVLRVDHQLVVVLCVVSSVVSQTVLARGLNSSVDAVQAEHHEAVSRARGVEPVRGPGDIQATNVVGHPHSDHQGAPRGALHHCRVIAAIEARRVLGHYRCRPGPYPRRVERAQHVVVSAGRDRVAPQSGAAVGTHQDVDRAVVVHCHAL